tara:strand:+ start:353 stop:622 length:270 start_codon:yes stop_codon:yes gene_type:complete
MKNKLPKWFDGTIYHQGDIVTNPFSGEEFYLNRYELSMYDFLKGAEYTLAIAQERMENHTIDDQLVKDFDKGRDWFIKNNSEAYMKLLD